MVIMTTDRSKQQSMYDNWKSKGGMKTEKQIANAETMHADAVLIKKTQGFLKGLTGVLAKIISGIANSLKGIAGAVKQVDMSASISPDPISAGKGGPEKDRVIR